MQLPQVLRPTTSKKLDNINEWKLDEEIMLIDSESEKAAEFAVAYEAVLDIDGEPYDYDPLRAVLPEK